MRDFANKMPRLAELAIAFANANGNITEQSQALLDAAMVEIPKLGWDAPFSLLAKVREVAAARKASGDPGITFDAFGNGPFCKHDGSSIPLFCPTCCRVEEAEDALRKALVALARAS